MSGLAYLVLIATLAAMAAISFHAEDEKSLPVPILVLAILAIAIGATRASTSWMKHLRKVK